MVGFLKYSRYVTNTLERLYKNGVRVRKVVIAVLYTADITKADSELNLEDFHIKVRQVFLSKFDTSTIYSEIKAKIDAGVSLSDEDVMKLIILPLTQPKKERKQRLIEDTVALAKQIQNEQQQMFILAGILTATNKFIDPLFSSQVKEWIKMTHVARLFEEEKYEALDELRRQFAADMLRGNEDIVKVMKYTKLTREEVERIKELIIG